MYPLRSGPRAGIVVRAVAAGAGGNSERATAGRDSVGVGAVAGLAAPPRALAGSYAERPLTVSQAGAGPLPDVTARVAH